MAHAMTTLRKISNTRLLFKNQKGYFTMKDFRIAENSGYALFTNGKEELYFTAINPKGRSSVAVELTSTILRSIYWTSLIEIGKAPKKRKT